MASTIKVDNVQNQPGTNIVNKCGTTVTVGAASDGIRSAGNNLQASDGGNLISQCGTDITLGASGDTINLASGASQSGFGRTGTVDWITTPKVTGDSPVTGVTGKGYFMNTTAGTITLNLPAGSAGDIVSLADYAATWQTNAVTISPNGSEKIGGVNSNVGLNTEGQSITLVYVDSTQGWVNTMDSTSNVRGSEFMSATVSGACNTLATAPCCANAKIATFLGPGTFCVTGVGASPTVNTVSYMVVAGGGAAQPPSNPLGGGGGGGFREYESPVTPYTASPLDGGPSGAGSGTAVVVTATAFPITVGGGGTPSPTAPGARGSDSVFSTITSTGGGGGGGGSNSSGNPAGPGGSGGGGGGSGAPNSGGTGNTPSVTPAQGTSGGANHSPDPSNTRGGGGGGATVAGAAGSASGNGGAGATTEISSASTIYAGGGGAGTENFSAGAAGPGGGGAGGAYPSCSATNGTDNTGGGAGGGYSVTKNGGSGIVIIRYQFQ
jgi:hypothetical protein